MEKIFTPKFNCHVLCKKEKLQKKGVQHAKKTGIPKSNAKVRILKEESGTSRIIKIVKREVLRELKF